MLPRDDVETKTIPGNYLTQIFEYIDNLDTTNLVNLRRQCMIYLLLDTGVRMNELLNIEVDNIDFNTCSIKLKYTKTRKHRIIFMTEQTATVVKRYIDAVNVKKYLIIDIQTGRKIHRTRLYKLLRKVKEDLQIPNDISISPHKFRHTYATTCLNNGASLEFIRRTLGHTNISTTQRYLHLDQDVLRKEHDMYNPMQKIRATGT